MKKKPDGFFFFVPATLKWHKKTNLKGWFFFLKWIYFFKGLNAVQHF